jgi:hypothetical protein
MQFSLCCLSGKCNAASAHANGCYSSGGIRCTRLPIIPAAHSLNHRRRLQGSTSGSSTDSSGVQWSRQSIWSELTDRPLRIDVNTKRTCSKEHRAVVQSRARQLRLATKADCVLAKCSPGLRLPGPHAEMIKCACIAPYTVLECLRCAWCVHLQHQRFPRRGLRVRWQGNSPASNSSQMTDSASVCGAAARPQESSA